MGQKQDPATSTPGHALKETDSANRGLGKLKMNFKPSK